MPTARVRTAAWVVGATLVGCAALGSAVSAASWLDNHWAHRMPFTAKADSIEGSTPLVRFPLLVRLDGSAHPAVFAQAKTDGSDLRFTSGDGVTLWDAEIVSYDAGSQQAEIWVRAETLSKSSNQFYLYYGNPLAVSASTSDTWVDYAVVYHFDQDPGVGTLLDSSPHQAHAHAAARPGGAWVSNDLVAAKIGSGWHYGANKNVNTSAIRVAQTTWTLGVWLKHENHSTDFVLQTDPCYFQLASQASDMSWDAQYNSSACGGMVDYRWGRGLIVLNEWHHFAWVYDGPNRQITFYYDGILQTPPLIYPAGSVAYDGHSLNPDGTSLVGVIGPMFANGGDDMNGIGDEFRIRLGTISAAWIRTEVRNQNAPQQFFVFGPPEMVPTGTSSWGGLKSRY
jgi:hypothetical protein